MQDEIIVKSVTTSKDWKNFIHLPWIINEGDKNWVPPLIHNIRQTLDKSNNPFWKNNPVKFFIAHKNNKSVGRIAAIQIIEHNRKYNDKTGFFGFLEAINDQNVFKSLLHSAEEWLNEKGCDNIIGPVNPSTNYELGFLIEGFDTPPFLMLTYNPPYYNQMMQSIGYNKVKDFYSYIIKRDTFQNSAKIQRITEYLLRRDNYQIRKVRLEYFDNELAILHEIYNDAFNSHWGFVPMPIDEFRFMAKDLKKIIDPELVLIIENNGEPAGFLLALPNYNEVFKRINDGRLFPWGIFKFLYYKRKIKGVRVVIIAIKQKFQLLGLGSLMYLEIYKRIVQRGYDHAELSWVIEDNNSMNNALREIGGKVTKKYRLYKKELSIYKNEEQYN